MSQTSNPFLLAAAVQERYRRYLKTMFYFRDPELRASFERALDAGHLAKGPYFEATPTFAPDATPRELFARVLGFAPDAGFLRAVQGERALYRHQARAIEKIAAGRNIVVATGTGSGKTESFLYPILLQLYQELRAGTLNRPGVRALVLYPMNALANDQRERLGAIAQVLRDSHSPFQFSFGQYIGETPEDERDRARNAQDFIARRLPGERVLRSEMRANPPHILLTNYSMLEYLLLRPADSELFDKGRAWAWQFLVLDEAHQYRGARGIEMALLLRRVKQRLREGGRREDFRCIATSASLVGGENDARAVAQFAHNLFAEPFDADDLILGETAPIPQAGVAQLDAAAYARLDVWLDETQIESARIQDIGARLGVSFDDATGRAEVVGACLERDARAAQLRNRTRENSIDLAALAAETFPELDAEAQIRALTTLIELCMRADSPATRAPLLSARYHLFLRALEGTFVAYLPTKRVLLDRATRLEYAAAFEVALCRECGQHYFVGRILDNKFVEAVRDPSQDAFGATYLRPIEREMDEEGEEEEDAPTLDLHWLCLECASVTRGELACGHAHALRVVKEESKKDDRADQIARCGACGYHGAGRDPVREIIYGADGPHAVITTTLFQELPKERRKILAFADGRQEAAFFAWYLDDSYQDLLQRNLVLKTIQRAGAHAPEGLTIGDIAHELRGVYRSENIYPATASQVQLRREAWRAVYRELLTDETRLSLEGVGAIRWTLRLPDWFEIPTLLYDAPWNLNESEARTLIALLLDTLRADRGVNLFLDEGVTLEWNDLGEHIRPRDYVLEALNTSRSAKQTRGRTNQTLSAWDGKRTRRVQFLLKILTQRGVTGDDATRHAQRALRALWQALANADNRAASEAEQLCVHTQHGRRLNPLWYRAEPLDAQMLYRCETCNRLQSSSLENICPRKNCDGTLAAIAPRALEPNHYRALYQDKLPGMMRVEEHTAQLDNEKARAFQRDFRDNKIDVLSCSTTFELGVDLGTLDTIFLRNMPPETFNYVQRVGRAGRRRGFPGFAITYCRRAPHDLYHFGNPDGMMHGKVSPPVLTIRNEKIVTRHLTALALSAFFRAQPERFASVEKFIGAWDAPRGASDVKTFLYAQRGALENSLRAIVPDELHAQLGLDDGTWVERATGTYQGWNDTEESRLVLAEREVVSDYQLVAEVKEQAKRDDDGKTLDWAKRRGDTLASEPVLNFLSRRVVIPKYGFPVDVVSLETQQTQTTSGAAVDLQRDLAIAISEFAPTNELVANKKVWKSHALKRVLGKEWERRSYKRCVNHNLYLEWKPGQAEPPLPCGDRAPAHTYVIPSFGFTTNREPPQTPSGRPVRVFTTRPYFSRALVDAEVLQFPTHAPVLKLHRASPGEMVVLCEGRRGAGFYICAECGSGLRAYVKEHETAFGKKCRGKLEHLALGHRFITDILRFEFQLAPPPDVDPLWFAYSLAYALLESAAAKLDVPPNDLNATVAHNAASALPPLVLYDSVPGGAGLVSRLENETMLRACLETARQRVSGACGCGDDTSCYGCLRSFRNQFAHQYLQRGPVFQYLETILSIWQQKDFA